MLCGWCRGNTWAGLLARHALQKHSSTAGNLGFLSSLLGPRDAVPRDADARKM